MEPAPSFERLPLVLSACSVDWVRGEVTRAGGTTERLTPRELELLAYLYRHRDRTVSRDELLAHVWGFAPSVVSRASDTAVRRLREKIEADPQQPDHLITAFGEGYRLVLPAPVEDVAPDLLTGVPEEDPFVGRAAEVVQLLGDLRSPGASVALHGPPGAGKTRIAKHLAHRLAGTLRGGSVWIDLTETRDLPQIAQVAAGALGIDTPGTGAVALRRAGEALRGRGPCLVLLDNCEGVREPLALALGSFRAAAPEARFLATSREVVTGVDDVVQIGPLPHDDAVALFEVLAQRVRPDFRIDGDSRAIVDTLVERLEHIPLALALAAGRAGAMSPRAILERLDDRFRLLSSHTRSGTGRHRTLRATLDSSWELLTAAEREVFVACSAFRGGFDLEAAQFVIARDDTEAVLTALCARSLLEWRGDRYGGYAFVREYATERLAELPEYERRVHRRHAEQYADRWRTIPAWNRPRRLSRDRSNLVAATERGVDAGWPETVGPTMLGALDVIGLEGPFELGLELCRAALTVPGLAVRDEVMIALRLCSLEQWTGAGDPFQRLDHAFALARESGDPALITNALRSRAMILRNRGSATDALPALLEAAQVARDGVAIAGLCGVLTSLGGVYRELGDYPRARAQWEEVVAIGSATHEGEEYVAHALGSIAMIERRTGNYDEARRLYQRSLDTKLAVGDRHGEATARLGLGNLELDLGRWDEARAQYDQVYTIARQIGVREIEVRVLGNLSICARQAGDLDTARRHLEDALEGFERMGEVKQAAQARGNLGEIELAAGEPELAVELLQHAVDVLRTWGDVSSACELSVPLAEAHLAAGDTAAAEALVHAIEPQARAIRNPLLLARVLACRGLVEVATGGDPTATLAEAEACAQGTSPSSESRSAVARLRAAIARAG